MNTSDKQLIALKLKKSWTPEQALAVYELLTELAELIWRRYENEILDPCLNPDSTKYCYHPGFWQENSTENPDDNFPF